MNNSNYAHVFLNLVNFFYLICGLCLIAGTISILKDTEKILISRLIPFNNNEPFLHYVCLIALILGLSVSILSTMGSWAILKNSYFLFSIYIFGVIVLLLGESVMGFIAAICPEYLGLTFGKESLTEIWQDYYGVPGKEQYTVAIDLVQIKMECCGVSGSEDYRNSSWHLGELSAPNLKVPISCCHLDSKQSKSYLDPIPANLSLCQESAPEKIYRSRHSEGCMVRLKSWLRAQEIMILYAALLNVVIQLIILFTVVSACVKNEPPIYDSKALKSKSSPKY